VVKLIVHETMTKFRINESVHRFIFKEAMQDERLFLLIKAIREVYPLESTDFYGRTLSSRNYQACLREMQFALATKDVAAFENISNIIKKDYKEYSPIPFFFTNPFEKEFLAILPTKIQATILKELLTNAIDQLKPIAPIEDFLEDAYAANPKNEAFRKLLGTLFIFQGQLKNEAIFFDNALGNKAWVAFLKGENDTAISLFAEDLKVIKKGTRKKKVFLKHIAAPFYLVALLKTGAPKYHKDIMTYAKNAQYQSETPAMDYLIGLMLHLGNDSMKGKWCLETTPLNSIDWVFKGVITYWMELQLTKKDLKQLEKKYALSIEHGLQWLAMEYATILSKLHTDQQQVAMYKEKALALQEVLGIESMIHALKKVEEWERILLAFEGLTSIGASTSTEAGGNTRIAWLVNFKRHLIQPKLQSRNKKGVWSQGRNIALKRLYSNGEDAITSQDQKIIDTIYTEQSPGYYGGTDYYFNFTNAVKAMVGHPRIFSYHDSSVLLEVTVVKPELIIEEKQNPTRYNLVQVDPIHQDIAKAMGKQTVSIPKKAKKRLNAFLKLMEGKIALHSTLAHSEENLPTNHLILNPAKEE